MRFIILILFTLNLTAQNDAQVISEIYKNSLLNGKSYDWLDYLSNEIGGRLSGSVNAERAVKWTKSEMELMGLDSVWLQPVMVPKWVRGAPEFAYIERAPGITTNVNICALGGSVSTPLAGLKAQVIEVQSFEQLEKLGKDNINGKIVFYNSCLLYTSPSPRD